MNQLYFTKPYRRSLKTLRLEFGEINNKFLLKSIEGEINGKGTSEFSPREEVFDNDQVMLKEVWETRKLSWFTRNTKNWHIVYNWLPYSKPIERDALCPDVHVADFQTFKKRKQSWLTSRMESRYPRYVRI